MCARFGRSPPLCCQPDEKESLQRYGVYQSNTLRIGYPVSRSIKAQPIVVRKTFLYFDVLKLARVISFKIVNREKRRFLGRTGRFYAFTFWNLSKIGGFDLSKSTFDKY